MERVRVIAKSHNLWVEAWWAAELAQDSGPQRVARLCAKNADSGWFLIEAGHYLHWLRFDVDGHTPWCRPGELTTGAALRVVPDDPDATTRGSKEPLFRRTHDTSIEHRQGNHSTIERVHIALRGGEPAIIWREHLYRPHCSEENTDKVDDFLEDWDARRAIQTSRRYDMRQPGPVINRVTERIVLCGEKSVPLTCPDSKTPNASESNGDASGFLGISVPIQQGGHKLRLFHIKGARYPRPDEAVVAVLSPQVP